MHVDFSFLFSKCSLIVYACAFRKRLPYAETIVSNFFKRIFNKNKLTGSSVRHLIMSFLSSHNDRNDGFRSRIFIGPLVKSSSLRETKLIKALRFITLKLNQKAPACQS